MNHSNRGEILFFKIWRNEYLKHCIFNHLNIYKLNEFVIVKSRNELIGYQFKEYISSLVIKFDEPLEYSDFQSMSELNKLEFHFEFKQSINFKLPDSIKSISNLNKLKTIEGESILPSNLNSLSFSYGLTQKLDQHSIPSTVEHLCFSRLNQSLEGLLPPSLKTLVLGFNYDKPLNDIPTSVQTLILSFKFNRPLVLPLNLKKLCLGHDFNIQLFPNDLPPTLETLSLGIKYNHPLLPGVIPNGVKLLQLSDLYSHPLQINSIPPSVTKLILKGYFKYLGPLQSRPALIPNSVTDLTFSFAQEISLSFVNLLKSNDLILSSVTKFSFSQIGYSFYPRMIPKNVTNLIFKDGFSYSLGPGDIQFGTTKVTFEDSSLLLLLKPHAIPSSVTHLSINSIGNHNLSMFEKTMSSKDIIPSTINKMTVTGFESNYLNRIIPTSIKELSIIYFRGQIHNPDNIPSTVSKVIIKRFNYDRYKNISKL